MYSFFNLEPISCSIQGSNCSFLTCIQVYQETGKMVWYSISLRAIPSLSWSISQRLYCSWWNRGFFLEIPCFFYDSANVDNLISGSYPFSKPSLNIWKFLGHMMLKPSLEIFDHYFASVWDEYNFVVDWTFFGTAFLWGWKENCPFPVLWPLQSFPNLLTYWVQHFNTIIFQDLK